MLNFSLHIFVVYYIEPSCPFLFSFLFFSSFLFFPCVSFLSYVRLTWLQALWCFLCRENGSHLTCLWVRGQCSILLMSVCVEWICWHYNNTQDYVLQLYYNYVVVQFVSSVHVRELSQIVPLFLAFAGNLRPSPLKTGYPYSYTYLHCKRELEDVPHLTCVRWYFIYLIWSVIHKTALMYHS